MRLDLADTLQPGLQGGAALLDLMEGKEVERWTEDKVQKVFCTICISSSSASEFKSTKLNIFQVKYFLFTPYFCFRHNEK